ncbi:MAG: flagellar protein FliT [Selenomonadaceae bacterium]|nr:flagellar protein FliT [Selenomonadaceae bacterium]
MLNEANEAAAKLWRKYLQMTEELLKFIKSGDVDIFLELVDQRVAIVDKMKELPEHTFRETEEFRELVKKIKPMDMEIMYKARTWLNKSRQQSSAVKAYDLTSTFGQGSIVNRKY